MQRQLFYDCFLNILIRVWWEQVNETVKKEREKFNMRFKLEDRQKSTI